MGGREKEELLLAWGGREVVCRSLSFKAGFHMIANDRRRSQREMFPYNRRRSQSRL